MAPLLPLRTMHLLTLITLATAFQFPSWIPFVHSVDPQSILSIPASATERIAIVGAGAAGSSAAFWLAKARERYGLEVEVDVYEKSGLVGGSECPIPVASRLELLECSSAMFLYHTY